MQIVELGDCSMVIGNSSYDVNKLEEIFLTTKNSSKVKVFIHGNIDSYTEVKSHLLTPDVFILYLSDKVPSCFHVGDVIGLKVGSYWFEKNYEDSRIR